MSNYTANYTYIFTNMAIWNILQKWNINEIMSNLTNNSFGTKIPMRIAILDIGQHTCLWSRKVHEYKDLYVFTGARWAQ